MLVVDAFKRHVTDSVKDHLRKIKTELVIPGGMTSVLQTMEVSINKSFKDMLRQKYLTWIADPVRELTETGKNQKQLLQKLRCGCWLHGKPSRRTLSSDLARIVV
jgi:hypothetical protein